LKGLIKGNLKKSKTSLLDTYDKKRKKNSVGFIHLKGFILKENFERAQYFLIIFL